MLEQMRDIAEREATRNYHRLRKWRRDARHHFRYTAWIEVRNEMHEPDGGRFFLEKSELIARASRPRTEYDYVAAVGDALISRCRGW